MNQEQIVKMAEEVIAFLKKKKMWQGDVGIIYSGIHIQPKETTTKNETTKGVMRMWFEGPLNHALNYGIGDKNYSIYKGLGKIFDKYNCYQQFDSNCDFNIYMKE